MLTTTSSAARQDSTASEEPTALIAARAQAAAATADIYRANATKIRDGYLGAPDRAWLTSQSAVCTARQRQCSELARRSDRDASRWQALALAYAEAAAILAKAGTGDEEMAAALCAAAELLNSGTLARARTISAAPAYVSLDGLTAAYREARDRQNARVVHRVEVEMLLLATYARDRNPALTTVVMEALHAFDTARGTCLPADVTQALDATAGVLREAMVDPNLNSG
jgi:hypothetical protein